MSILFFSPYNIFRLPTYHRTNPIQKLFIQLLNFDCHFLLISGFHQSNLLLTEISIGLISVNKKRYFTKQIYSSPQLFYNN